MDEGEYGNGSVVGEEVEDDVTNRTVGEILGQLRKRGKGLQPMPSTVARRVERQKRKRGHDGEAQDGGEEAGEGTVDGNGGTDGDAAGDSGPQQPDETPEMGPSVMAPQLRLDADGNIVIDEASLVVTAGGPIRDEHEVRDVTTVEFGTNHVTSLSFRPRERTPRWTEADTELFYEGLRKFGTDFAMIAQLFGESRTRKQIKLKFNREERIVPSRVEAALRQRVMISEEELRRIGATSLPPASPASDVSPNVAEE